LLAIRGVDTDVIADTAAAAGIVLHEITPEHSSLEEVFLSLTHGSVEYEAVRVEQDGSHRRPSDTRRQS
jgi:ABC-2 type transport system ATP-binding protein